MTVGELLERMSSRELTEWVAFYGLEPFGPEQDAWRAGLVASAVYNTARQQKSDPVLRPQDFMPGQVEEPEPEDQAAMLLAKARAVNAMIGGKDRTAK